MVVYQIKNNLSGMQHMRYIGQTVGSLDKRWREHCHKSSNCVYISRAIQKYGKENFTIEVLDRGESLEDLNNKEEFWIKFLDTMAPNGYNLMSGGCNSLHSEETRKKMSESQKGENNPFYGKQHTEETKQKISVAAKNDPNRSKRMREIRKLSKGNKGNTYSEETKKKMSELKKGKKHTEEHKKKISESLKGRIISEKTKKKISESLKGRIISEKTKKKMSELKKGRIISEKTKKKISESLKWRKLSK